MQLPAELQGVEILVREVTGSVEAPHRAVDNCSVSTIPESVSFPIDAFQMDLEDERGSRWDQIVEASGYSLA